MSRWQPKCANSLEEEDKRRLKTCSAKVAKRGEAVHCRCQCCHKVGGGRSRLLTRRGGARELLTVIPDLLIAECANILWKKVRRSELTPDEAIAASRLLQRANIEVLPTWHLMDDASELAIQLDHAAYDCIYLMLGIENDWQMITADRRLRHKIAESTDERLIARALSMQEGIVAGKQAASRH